MYLYQAPIIKQLHKCRYCGTRLSKVPEEDIVAKTAFDGEGVSIRCFYCDKECAKRDYNAESRHESKVDELNNFIMEGGPSGK